MECESNGERGIRERGGETETVGDRSESHFLMSVEIKSSANVDSELHQLHFFSLDPFASSSACNKSCLEKHFII